MTTQAPLIDEHPDIIALRMQYDRAAETRTAQMADGLTFLTGLYLAMSPWVTGFAVEYPSLAASNLFTGIALALLAVGFASAYGRTHGLVWVAPVLGLWAIVSPMMVSGVIPDLYAVMNNVTVGMLCLVCSVSAMYVGLESTSGMRPLDRPFARPFARR